MERRVAIVTGASRGIGRAVALGLAEDGFSLALLARSAAPLEQLANEIADRFGEGGQRVLTFPIDIRDHVAGAAAVANVQTQLGRIDLLFNNAGLGLAGSLDLSSTAFEELLAVNVGGAWNMLQAVVPRMKEQRSGVIINVASRAGKVGVAGYAGYSASKFGLVGLSEVLYRELTPLGIRVTALCPSRVDTNMAHTMGLGAAEMVPTEDVVRTVRWLLALSPTACVREVVIECRGFVL